MEIITEQKDDAIVVTPETDVLDAGNTDAFKAAIFPILDDHKQVILDLAKLAFIDSSGCGTLLSCYNRMKSNNGKLKIFGVQEQVLQVFDLIRIDRIIDIFETKDAALESG